MIELEFLIKYIEDIRVRHNIPPGTWGQMRVGIHVDGNATMDKLGYEIQIRHVGAPSLKVWAYGERD